MQDVSDPVPAQAFEKDAFQLTVEDVYDISYVIGRDLLKITQPADVVSELQFKIVRVLEMFEALVNRYSLTVEELKMERDNLKTELDRILGNCANGQGTVSPPSGDWNIHGSEIGGWLRKILCLLTLSVCSEGWIIHCLAGSMCIIHVFIFHNLIVSKEHSPVCSE